VTAQSAAVVQERCDLVASEQANGAPIYGVGDVRLGRIDRLITDKTTGKPVYAVMICESDDCVRSEYYPLPIALLKPRAGREGYEAELIVQELKGAPKFCRDELWDWASRERGQFLHDYYNVPPYWGM
jgi:hypothetical protein